jgi:predicted RNA-binding protein with PUA-like domain
MKPKAAQKGGWLFKEEPTHYSYDDLERDRQTVWDGIDNNLARKNLRTVQPGDRVLYYHTGTERAVVGEMRVLSAPKPDPARPEDKAAVVVEVEAVRRWPKPVTLERIKQEPLLKTWELVRLPRLSVVPVSAEQWQRLEEMAGS